MLITAPGQLATPANAAEIRDQMLRDMRLAAVDANIVDSDGNPIDPPVQPGTDWFMVATAVSNVALIGFANISLGLDAQNVLTAEGDDLDQIREGLGLPEVPSAPSSGKITIQVVGVTTIVDGTAFILPNGLRGKVVGTYINPGNNSDLNAVCVDTGTATNLASGQTVRFVSPPTNLLTDALVSQGAPLTGGTDAESDKRKRARILNTLQNKPAGGNWGYIRQVVLDSLGTVIDCFVYPAPGGPGSTLVVPVKDFDPENNDFSRALSSAALQTVTVALQQNMPTPQEIVVESSLDVSADVTLSLTLPSSSLSGGNGQGWIDPTPWPPLLIGDSGTIAVTAVATTNDQLTIDAATTTAPIDGLTHVAWWSAVDREFQVATVISHSGATTAWVVNLDRALVSSNGNGPAVGDFVCPAAQNLDAYGNGWVQLFRGLGTGELTSDINRLPRSLRHPFLTVGPPCALTAKTVATFVDGFPEITDYAISYAPVTAPSVPAAVDDPVQILVPRKFAVYQQ